MSWAVAIWAGLIGLIAAIVAVTRTNIVHALMFLLAALISLAAAFFALAASFAGVIQLLIYAGAIVAVFVFVVMTVDSGPEANARERAELRRSWRMPAAITLLAIVPLSGALLMQSGQVGTPGGTEAGEIGLLLFGPWAVALELISLLLLAALIGVRHLSRRQGKTERGE